MAKETIGASLTPLVPGGEANAGKFQEGALRTVVLSPNLASMAADPSKAAAKPDTTKQAMAASINATLAAKAAAGKTMQPFTGPVAAKAQTPGSLPAMVAHDAPVASTEKYVRMRVRVTDSAMRIVGVQTVDGPLTLPDSFVGANAYEVVLDSHRIAAEGIADIGVRRSYPRPGQLEHHITQLTTFEFNVRVPLSALPAGALERVQINLYQFQDALPKPLTGIAMLSTQFGTQAKMLARLDGLKVAVIEPHAIEQLKKAIPTAVIR